MAPPTSKKELQTFLGFIQYLLNFLPYLSKKTANPRILLKSVVVIKWGSEQNKSFEELKTLV